MAARLAGPELLSYWTATPRNAPCPCGSGQRFKRCHGQTIVEDPARAEREILDARLSREVAIMGADQAELRALFAESDRERDRYAADLSQLTGYCLFIGYPRSGHSLIGALLDAHPEIVVAHELDVATFLGLGFDRAQIAYLLIENARRCAALGRKWGAYDYQVPGQWQGRYRSLKVLGDKKGGRTTLRISETPSLLGELRALFDDRVTFIHVVRNPFDVIATVAKRSGQALDRCIESVFAVCETNNRVRVELGPDRVIDIWHEAVLRDPAQELARLCGAFGLAAPPDYLAACAQLVGSTPRRSRHDIAWSARDRTAVAARAKGYDFLAHYDFER